MAKMILDQFVYLKQPACDYLSQCYNISCLFKDLIEEFRKLLNSELGFQFNALSKGLEQLLQSFQTGVQAAHNAMDDGINPYSALLSLNVSQNQGRELLRDIAIDLTELKHMLLQAADELDSYDGFESYAKEVARAINNKKEAAND